MDNIELTQLKYIYYKFCDVIESLGLIVIILHVTENMDNMCSACGGVFRIGKRSWVSTS